MQVNFSFDATFLLCFSGNWNGTESVEEWDFLWGPRYDLFSARLFSLPSRKYVFYIV